MRITESQLRRVIREAIQDYDPMHDGGEPFVGTSLDGMPMRKKKHLVEPGKYYVFDQRGHDYELKAGPFDSQDDAIRHIISHYGRERFLSKNSSIIVLRGIHDGHAERVDPDGYSVGPTVQRWKLY